MRQLSGNGCRFIDLTHDAPRATSRWTLWGLRLENYDAVGRWRTKDGPFPIDPSGELLGGRKFADAQELKQVLGGLGVEEVCQDLDQEPADLRAGARAGSLRLLHHRGHSPTTRRRRLSDAHADLRDRREQGLSILRCRSLGICGTLGWFDPGS